jgi:hypothetical protein
MYNTTLNLKDSEVPAKLDKETGELIEVQDYNKINNVPDNKFRIKYTKFSCVSTKAQEVCMDIFTNEELGVIYKMIAITDFNSNSLAPLNDDTSCRMLAEEFGINKNKVGVIFKKLFDWGVYAQMKIAADKTNEYWILNPYLAYKGKLVEDRLMIHFAQTKLSKLIK